MFESKEEESGSDTAALVALRDLLTRRRRFIVSSALLGLGAGVLFVGMERPVYRATATLLLESDTAAGGILGDLAAITSAPVATSQMEILRSRGIAEAVVGAPQETPDWIHEEHPQKRLGLTTLVEEHGLRTLPGFWRRLISTAERPDVRPLLRAIYTSHPGAEEAPPVEVEFVGNDRVRISSPSRLSSIGFSGSNPVDHDFRPGGALDLPGGRLRLFPDGNLSGRSYTVRALHPLDALEYVLKRTRVSETERNSGVIRLVYDDSDPHRAAAIAHALCLNYLERNEESGQRRASKTVDFIEDQLVTQLASLEEAEVDVVTIQKSSPGSVDIGESARALIDELSGIAVEQLALRVSRTELEQVLELLREGRVEALARLGPALADPITGSYVEQMARLMGERDLLERREGGAYKTLVQEKALEIAAEAEKLALKLSILRGVAASLEAGDVSGLGRLASAENTGTRDPILSAYLEQWAQIEGEIAEYRASFTDEMPEVARRLVRRETLLTEMRAMISSRIVGLGESQGEYAKLQREYKARVASYPDDERTQLDQALKSLRERTHRHLDSRLGGLRTRATALEEEAKTVEARLVQLPEDQRLLAEPMRRLESHTEIVKFLLARQKEAQITHAAMLASAQFIDRPAAPMFPRGPSVPMFALLGLFLGAGASIALSFLREALDRQVVTAEEVEDVTGLAVYGSIPNFRRGPARRKGVGEHFLALRDDPEGPIAEAYRSMRSNLKFVLGTDVKVLTCTSSTSNEGKTTTNIDIALAFALVGRRVLLVDADMRCASVSRLLQLSPVPGLAEVLQGDIGWRECVQEPGIENLSVMAAGKQPKSPGDLLAGVQLGRFLEEVREAYDLVVFDVPPVLEVADMDCLASRLDAVLLLCRSGKLPQSVLEQAARQLQHGGAKVIGAVLNAVLPSGSKKYGYGYGYGERAA